jgi:anti-sigma B factor antagonist
MTAGSTIGSGSPHDHARIQVSAYADCVLVSVAGEVDMHSAGRLARLLQALTPASLCLVLDLTHLTFIDSSGLGVLIAARNRAGERGTSLVLVDPPPLVRRLLSSTMLQHTFDVYDTVDDALRAVQST